MRYIPDLASDVIVQVPEDKNAYINVRNIGASGRGDLEFTGTVTDIDAEGVVTISNIDDGEGNSIFQYTDVLKSGVGIQLFGYRTPGLEETPILSVSSSSVVNVDFSGSLGANPNLAPLTYYVFGFDPQTGRLPFFRSTVTVGTKVLNPDLWGTEQYVQLDFIRTSQYALPVIYRVWGSRVDFLGVIGNNKIGYPGSGTQAFRDLGLLEIPGWESDPLLPYFLSNVFSVTGVDATQIRKVVGKERVTILPNQLGTLPSYIQCTGLSANSQLQAGDTVTFTLDDTSFVQTAINLASTSDVKEIFFPAGIYNVADTFFTNTSQSNFSNISIRGVGDGSVIRRLPCTLSNPGNPGILNFTGESVSPRVRGIRLRSIAFDGNRTESFSQVSPITSEVGLQIRYADNVVINDCTVTGCGGGGIALYDTKGASLIGNTIRLTGRSYEQTVSPLLIDTSENVVAQANLLEFATTGPKVISTDYSTINGNIIRACGDNGLVLETSFQWNAQGNLAYSDNDSLIRSIDTYNNEYSKAAIEVRSGFALDPVYMTVTLGGESVGILKNSVNADIYALDSSGIKTTPAIGAFRVLETSAQLEAGIFSLTLPATTSANYNGKTIPATNSLTNADGYMYEVKATVLIGRNLSPLSILSATVGGNQYVAVRLRNPSDILGFQIYSASSPENDRIKITGFDNTNLAGLDQDVAYTVIGIDTDTNSLLLNPISGLTLTTTPIEFLGGSLYIQRSDYFVADGNLIVHS
jgi:parallel beta-helix repeat protein